VDLVHALSMVELCSIATPELKCMSAIVNRIKYTLVHEMSGPIECTSMVTQITMNLRCSKMANLH
jgi:hypothetical protein